MATSTMEQNVSQPELAHAEQKSSSLHSSNPSPSLSSSPPPPPTTTTSTAVDSSKLIPALVALLETINWICKDMYMFLKTNPDQNSNIPLQIIMNLISAITAWISIHTAILSYAFTIMKLLFHLTMLSAGIHVIANGLWIQMAIFSIPFAWFYMDTILDIVFMIWVVVKYSYDVAIEFCELVRAVLTVLRERGNKL
jgi:hypothetical protein